MSVFKQRNNVFIVCNIKFFEKLFQERLNHNQYTIRFFFLFVVAEEEREKKKEIDRKREREK